MTVNAVGAFAPWPGGRTAENFQSPFLREPERRGSLTSLGTYSTFVTSAVTHIIPYPAKAAKRRSDK